MDYSAVYQRINFTVYLAMFNSYKSYETALTVGWLPGSRQAIGTADKAANFSIANFCGCPVPRQSSEERRRADANVY